MRSKEKIVELLLDPGVIAIVRAKSAEQFLPVCRALLEGGVVAIEITMTTPNALEAIREARAALAERAVIGVGTVLDAKTCAAAVAEGAEFVVTPICRTELIAVAHQAGRPICSGRTLRPRLRRRTKAGRISSKYFRPTQSGRFTSKP